MTVGSPEQRQILTIYNINRFWKMWDAAGLSTQLVLLDALKNYKELYNTSSPNSIYKWILRVFDVFSNVCAGYAHIGREENGVWRWCCFRLCHWPLFLPKPLRATPPIPSASFSRWAWVAWAYSQPAAAPRTLNLNMSDLPVNPTGPGNITHSIGRP